MILVTGATGFVGKALVELLLTRSIDVSVLIRIEHDQVPGGVIKFISDLTDVVDWEPILQGTTSIVHVAGLAHILKSNSSSSGGDFESINTYGTINFARQAAKRGIKRFVFISSVKANGETTLLGAPFSELDQPSPSDPYGLSKFGAEQGLLEIARQTEMEVVIIRPPLVYGPGVKANFANMMRCVKKGVPLPLGAINNKRSLIALDNLVDFILLCTSHPKAANEVFFISDGEDVSTTVLLKKVAKAYDKSAILLPVPTGILKLLARLMGKKDVVGRLLSTLQVDSNKARQLLNWTPVVTMDEQLKRIVELEK